MFPGKLILYLIGTAQHPSPPKAWSGRSVKPLRLAISGAIIPLRHTPSCCVHRQLATFCYTKCFNNTLNVALLLLTHTGRFIMFSLITNVYNRKTKGPTLMELFTATGKLKTFFFLTTRDVRCVHHGWHGTHRYDIQVLATHASTWMHRYFSLLQWSVPLGQWGHVVMVLCVLCTKYTLHSNHRLTRVIFQHTKRLLPGAAIFPLHTLA